MHGNVWEWTESLYFDEGALKQGGASRENPEGFTVVDRTPVITCGGAFFNRSGGVTSAIRDYNRMEDRNAGVGFRVARTGP